jgi:hypothetical protein
VAGSCEHSNEPLGSIKGAELLDQHSILHGVYLVSQLVVS